MRKAVDSSGRCERTCKAPAAQDAAAAFRKECPFTFRVVRKFTSTHGVCGSSRGETEALQAGELTLLVADNSAGYFGVSLDKPGKPKPYQAEVRRGGKNVHLGSFATAEEAALCVARTPEGQAAAAERAAAAVPLTSEEARQQAQAEKLTLTTRLGRGRG